VTNPPLLEPYLVDRIRSGLERLRARGALVSKEEVATHVATFRRNFGPDVLASLDGEKMLSIIHDHGNKASLVYWLEFKDDDEFPAHYGSIAGGSALKFGIYRRKETGAWTIGSPTNQKAISLEDAIHWARRNRDQLVAGARYLDELPRDPERVDYDLLQQRLLELAPDLAETSWGHKYFALLAHEILDDYHAQSYQHFHLLRLLVSPPEGRYRGAREIARIARHLDVLPVQLSEALNEVDGEPRRWLRIGTTEGSDGDSMWAAMRDGGYVAVGWPAIPALGGVVHDSESKTKLKGLMAVHYPSTPSAVGNAASQLFDLVARTQVGDTVVAMKGGRRVLGVGRITAGYQHSPGSRFPHQRPVEWLSLGEWDLPEPEPVPATYRALKEVANIHAVERRIGGANAISVKRPTASTGRVAALLPLSSTVARIDAALRRKGQVILYGPPGTGKTHHAEEAARELAARAFFKQSWTTLESEQQSKLLDVSETGMGAIETCCFHPAYGYEDFLEGYRPHASSGGALAFMLRDGVFKRLCTRAAARPDGEFFLIIDEINRGDVPRIFGELLTVLEKTRRGRSITLPVSGSSFAIPSNVFVIATMNTVDRSIALLDAALRRRFAFVELMPRSDVLGDTAVRGIGLGAWLESLNGSVKKHLGRDARNLQIGHSYLLEDGKPVRDFRRFREILRDEIVPLLEEHCYDRLDTLEQILGKSLFSAARGAVDESLFVDGREDELVKALLATDPGIGQTFAAVANVSEDDADETDEET